MSATTCQSCGATLPEPGASCPACGHTASSPSALPALNLGIRGDGLKLGSAKTKPAEGGPAMTMRLEAVTLEDDEAPDETRTPTQENPVVLRPATRRRSRALPLVGLLAFGLLAFLAAGFALSQQQRASVPPAVAPPPPPSEGPATVDLEAGEATLGLSEDNKEVVLALCFQLSSHPSTECRVQAYRDTGEFPARIEQVPPLTIDKYEVSNGDWAACEAAGACVERDLDSCAFFTVVRGRELRSAIPDTMLAPDRPAICANFIEAVDYCRWRGMRVPTADEWERASRSGDDRLQPWGAFVMPGLANWGERVLVHFPIPGRVDGYELTAPVDAYRSGATDEGVHNMLGNVAEWVQPRDDDPSGHAGVRGGSYVEGFQDLRLTYHGTLPRDARRSTVGFRCVR